MHKVKILLGLNYYLCFRYLGILKIKEIGKHLSEIRNMISKLKSDKERSNYEQLLKSTEVSMANFVPKIREGKASTQEIDKSISNFEQIINDQIMSLKGKLIEQERLLKIQAQIEEEKKRKDEEERLKREEEEAKRRKAEMEERQKLEALRLEQELKMKQGQQQALLLQKAAEEERERQRLEQEKRDYELASRLANESANGFSDSLSWSPTMSPRQNTASPTSPDKYNLSKWKYSELRDTINTSCDLELLEACREEFHRRLKVYHAWKSRNAKPKQNNQEERAPNTVMQYTSTNPFINFQPDNSHTCEQRYFRIPFVRPSSLTGEKGWWFAHFDGQWIARQLELHPDKPPILLVAGEIKSIYFLF